MKLHRLLSVVTAFAGLLAVGACGNDIGGAGPCATFNPPPECSQACDTANPCPLGYYCAADGTCDADCVAGSSSCGSGYICTDEGKCEPDGNSGGDGGNNGCPNVGVQLKPEIPTVQLLIDQSGSMTENFGNTDRWSAEETALVGNNGIVPRLQDRVRFGATMYTSFNGNSGGTCPATQEVAPMLNNFTAINQLFTNNQPEDDTPTAESVDHVVANFPIPDPEDPGPRIIVLSTDGNPDNCVDPDAHDLGSQMLTETAVQNAFSVGLNTFVLSVGDQVSASHLQRVANAGVGQPLGSGTAPYYVANNPSELVDAFDDIIRGVRNCNLTVNGTVDLDLADQGIVTLNGVDLVYGVDWTMLDENTMQLLGAACDTFLNEDQVALDAQFPCDVVVL